MATEILPPLESTDLTAEINYLAYVSAQIHNLHKHIAGIEANANKLISDAQAAMMPIVQSPQVQMLLEMAK